MWNNVKATDNYITLFILFLLAHSEIHVLLNWECLLELNFRLESGCLFIRCTATCGQTTAKLFTLWLKFTLLLTVDFWYMSDTATWIIFLLKSFISLFEFWHSILQFQQIGFSQESEKKFVESFSQPKQVYFFGKMVPLPHFIESIYGIESVFISNCP